MKYLGIDYGTKKIGLSISDKNNLIASSYNVINNTDDLISDIRKIIQKEKIEHIVLGFPKNMDNSIGESANKVLNFKKELENEINIKISLQDERLTSKEGNDILIKNNIRRNKRKNIIDKIAATILLQTFLDKERNNIDEK